MGLSIAIGGGIICATVLLVLSIMFSLTTQTYEVNSARSQSSEIERTWIHTDFTISDLYAQSGSDRVSFTLQNTGLEKLWNYNKFSVIVKYNATIAGNPVLTSEYLTYDSTTAFDGAGVSSGSTQFARPDQDVSKENWDDAVGGDNDNILYDEIDESARNDADYATSGSLSLLDTSETWETGLTNVIDPQTSSNHIVKYVYRKNTAGGNVIDLTVRLIQGSTTIASWTHTNIGETFTLASQTLSAVQTDSITNYSDLRLRFTGTYSSGLSARAVEISWAEFEVPAASGIYDCSLVSITAGKWTIDRIMSDLMDPRILNSSEDSRVCIKLSNNVHSGSNVLVSVATDLGKTESSSINI